MKGLFIVFEGHDFAGKTTQIKILAEYLKKATDREIVVTREPGGSTIGSEVRKLMLTNHDIKLDGLTELLLVMSDRSQHFVEVIEPALKRGAIVLCDRHVVSTITYQGYGRGIYRGEIERLNNLVMDNVEPDFTFFLRVTKEEKRNRMVKRGLPLDKLENDVGFVNRVSAGLEDLMDEYNLKGNALLLPFDGKEANIHAIIARKTLKLIQKKQ